ncbi:MAG: type III-A CRISPR-associated protein Csm2 [Chloroflexota bacterium]|nr:type III-A CRISPR-associated protein Csm2 [Chloroflexota bacterium]MBI5702584.1 type III-A CRISPR-associated protein Csm2 [Chloroflexota bacterium]
MSYQSSPRPQYQGNRPTGQSSQSNEPPVINDETLKKIVVDGNAELIVQEADRIGKLLVQGGDSDKLSTSQIRAIFGEVRKIQGQIAIPEHTGNPETVQKIKERAFRRLHLLIPKMKYRVAKEKEKPGIKNLVKVLVPALEQVFASGVDKSEKEKRFGYFVEFFEAILAYHRAYGGK